MPRSGFATGSMAAAAPSVFVTVVTATTTFAGALMLPYRRFLEARFRKEFDLVGTPLRIEFKTSHNPYADKPGA